MRRLLLAVPVVLVVACGDDEVAPLDTPPATAAPPTAGDETLPTVPPAGSAYQYPTGPDDVVIGVLLEGGFVPAQLAFANTPVAMITGDGRALSTGPTTMQFPGPLLPNLLQQSITPAGIEQLLAQADELGLLADVDYATNVQVADAPTTVVTISADGASYVHEAYALDVEPETDPARKALSQFIAAMTDLTGTLGGEVGPEEPYSTEAYLIQAEAIEPETMSFDVEPTIVPWPADAPVRLADAAECAEVPAAFGDGLFADATQLTFFADAEATYQVAAVQRYPGRAC
jgi:hypothetical protein